MRLLHLIVVAALVCAAAYVYKIKFDSTLQAERVAKLRSEIRRERDVIAALRAEWSQLDNPTRIQALAHRHLTLKPAEAMHLDLLLCGDLALEPHEAALRAEALAQLGGSDRRHP